jgi:hypothetical protein
VEDMCEPQDDQAPYLEGEDAKQRWSRQRYMTKDNLL